SVVFTEFLHVILGIYLWEWVSTLDFDIAFLQGKKMFKWPLIFYFWGRYAMLGGLIGFIIAIDSTRTYIHCQQLYTVLQVLGNSALGVASINLAIRTMVIWSYNRSVVVGLVALSCGHFAIIIRSMFNVSAEWIQGSGCATTRIESVIFAAMYIYTMCFDFIVMSLTAYKLIFAEGASFRRSSAIMKLLFRDGLVYFVIAFGGNFVAVIFSVLNLNTVMALIADIPATTFATIAACRVVRRLNNYVGGVGL
ncbi:hypothetical protein FISHEDRAFT_36981, partial [Fistulina hepatica ATCC 64428]